VAFGKQTAQVNRIAIKRLFIRAQKFQGACVTNQTSRIAAVKDYLEDRPQNLCLFQKE
jgi:hypothetical protein